MELLINGKREQMGDVQTLVQVLENMKVNIEQGGIAVAVNDKVVTKSRWSAHAIREGDRIEVIHAVQGG
jgi:sulfur carrier protein